MANLPIMQSADRTLQLLQNRWASQLNPVLANRFVQGRQITGVRLISGDNVINHLLSAQQNGWVITDQTAAASIYRSAPLNDTTLTLNSSAPVTVSLWVY